MSAAHGAGISNFEWLREAPPDLYITEQLEERPVKKPDHLQEKLALQELAARMLHQPGDVLPRFVELAMHMTGGASAGVSLFEQNPAPGVFRWRYLSGSLARFENAQTPRNFSPCGMTLDLNTPVLSRRPERFYDWISQAHIEVPEVLLVPLYIGEADPLGTLWIVAEEERHFDSGHARLATELAAFVGIALRMLKTEEDLKSALAQQQTLTQEMGHRVQNLFAIMQSLVRFTARTSITKEEMSDALQGRVGALASAHGLVRRSFSAGQQRIAVSHLDELLRAISRPYERQNLSSSIPPRFVFQGPDIGLGEHAITGVALIFSELITNALKYGALQNEHGSVQVNWVQTVDGSLKINWREEGGPAITEPPETAGFGSTLLRDTISRQFKGDLRYDWKPEGLQVTIMLPMVRLGE